MGVNQGRFSMVNRYQFFFALGAFLLGMGMVLLSVAVWFRFHVEMPADDIAFFLPSVKIGLADGWLGISLDDWLALTGNAHRIAVTRLLMLADYAFFGGKNYAIYMSAWVSIALLFAIYLRAFDSQVSTDKTGHYFIAGISLIFLCTPSQYFNLVKPINASWYVAAASSAISVWMIISAGKNLSFGRALLALIFAAIAAFSNFFGVLTCLALPVVALYQRSRLWVGVLLFSLVFLPLYLQGVGSDRSYAPANSAVVQQQFQASMSYYAANPDALEKKFGTAIVESPDIFKAISEQSSSPRSVWLRKSMKVVRGICEQLGAPLSIKHPLIASLAVIGSVLLIFFHWLKLAIGWYFRREPASRPVQFYLAMATICLGVSWATSIGRNVFSAPQAERYQTMVMLYWLSISCLVYCLTLHVGKQRRTLLSMLLAATVPLLFVWGTLDSSMPGMARFHNRVGNEQVLGRLGLTPLRENMNLPAAYNQLIRSNHDFLRNYAFRPLDWQASHVSGAKSSGELCNGMSVNTGATEWPGVQRVFLEFNSNEKPFLTRLDLMGDHGEVGNLYAKASPEFQLQSILLGFNRWEGYYRGDLKASNPVILAMQSILGEPSYCVLQL